MMIDKMMSYRWGYKRKKNLKYFLWFGIGIVSIIFFISIAIVVMRNKLEIKDYPVSWGIEVPCEKRAIDTIIIHSSYDASHPDPFNMSGIIAEYKSFGVTPHYIITRDGTIYRLVAEKYLAHHAGIGKDSRLPDGREDVNLYSIGIELINTMTTSPTMAQYAALNRLICDIKTRYKIKYILGHKDIAPGRKTDPWNFDWRQIQPCK